MLTSNSPSNWRKETKWKLKRQKMTSNWSIIWAFSYRKMIELSWFPFGTSFENDSSFSTYWSSLVQVTVQPMLSLVPQLVHRRLSLAWLMLRDLDLRTSMWHYLFIWRNDTSQKLTYEIVIIWVKRVESRL